MIRVNQAITNSSDFLGQSVTVKIDRAIRSRHPKFGWEYQLNYGFVPETQSPDGEELDAYIIGLDYPIKEFTGMCIAYIRRLDDDDDKLIVVTPDKLSISNDAIWIATQFQEQYFESELIRQI